MKKCEYCGRENDDAATACAECTTEFPSASPPEKPEEQPLHDPALALATVATFRNPMDAGMFKARLEAAGIEACVPEEYTPHIFWNVIPSPLEHVTVRVAAKDYEAAKALLGDYADHSITAALPDAWAPESERLDLNPQPQATASDSGVRCSICGGTFGKDAVIGLGNQYVCWACKPIATQRLKEGVLKHKESEQLRHAVTNRPCVACGVLLPEHATLCPKCGHLQN